MLVLDTNILIEIEAHNLKLLLFLQKLLQKYPTKPYITAPTYSEFLYGFLLHSFKKKEKGIEFLEAYEILHTSKNSARLLAEIKYVLEKQGEMIPVFDILIASIVMDRNATLLTMDTHFKKIKGLHSILFYN